MDAGFVDMIYGGIGLGLYSAAMILFSLRSRLAAYRRLIGLTWPVSLAEFWIVDPARPTAEGGLRAKPV